MKAPVLVVRDVTSRPLTLICKESGFIPLFPTVRKVAKMLGRVVLTRAPATGAASLMLGGVVTMLRRLGDSATAVSPPCDKRTSMGASMRLAPTVTAY